MQSQELASLESRLLDPLPIPIIGQCLQKRAAVALAEDRSPEAVKLLAKAVTRLGEPEIKASILDALGNLRNQNCIDAVCEVWADTRHRDLANLLIKKSWVASEPVKLKVITALKVNQPQMIINGGKEVVEPLLNAFKDRDSEIANRASECAVCLTNPEAINCICHLVIEQDHLLAHQIAIKAQYAPREPSQRALFYFLTEQWDSYESLDYEYTLLQAAFEHSNEQLRQKITEQIRKAGRVEWVKVIAGGRKGQRLEKMTDSEWEATLNILSNNKQWEEMWGLAQKAPAFLSRKLLQNLKQVSWLPEAEEERKSFKRLVQLANKCLKEIPPMAGLTDCKATLTHHTDWIWKISFSSNSKIFASCGNKEKEIRLWQIPDGQHLATLTGHTDSVRDISFSPDSKILASRSACNRGNKDKTIKLWRIPDGQHLATPTGHTDWVQGISFSPDNKILASCSSDETIRLWRMPDGQHLATLTGHTNWVRGISFSPDSKILASRSAYNNGSKNKTDKTIRLWKMPNGQHLATLTGHTDWVQGISFSSNSKILASYSNDKTIRLWQMPDGQHLATLTGHTDQIQGINFSPDGKIFASYSSDKTIRLWQMPDGQHLATLTGHTDSIRDINFSPDGKILASYSNDKTIKLWQMPNGQHLATLTGHTDSVWGISFSSNSKILASCSRDTTIRLWRMPDGQHLATLTGHTDSIRDISFSPDDKILVSHSNDKTIKLWSSISRLSIRKLNQRYREFIEQSLQNEKRTDEEKNWLEFMQALINWHRRFDVEVEDAPQLVSTGKFDIEIEG